MGKKRKYTKRDQSYWANKSLGMSNQGNSNLENKLENVDFEPKTFGDPLLNFETAKASRLTGSGSRTKSRSNRITRETARDRFNNIDDGILPWNYSRDGVSISEAVLLTQKAYFNIAAFKSTLDLLSEFANTDIYFKGGDASSLKFVKAWCNLIGLDDIKEQYFREYYRSGNVFIYELKGSMTKSSVRSFKFAQANEKKEIPVKYILLNPADILVEDQLSFGEFTYAKALTPFEIARLKENNKSEHDQKIYDALPSEIKDQLRSDTYSSNNKEILLPLSSDILHPVFNKKQDYEPLAIPVGFCVLDDLNKKMELKKVDQAIARSIENVTLLVTMGAEPDKGGINYQHIKAMQSIFENQSVGRVLVSDYTTKMDFVMPDLRKVMGKEKYEILNKDIEEGLSNILIGDSKYSNTELKMKVFFERLNESRRRFLQDFFQKQINKVCKSAGFRNPPTAEFIKKDILSSEYLQRLMTRMMELGILTPTQGIEVIKKGEFPEAEDMEEAQDKYIKSREKGHYLPMVAGPTLFETENQNSPDDEELKKYGPNAVTEPKGRNQKATIANPSGGRPVGTARNKFSVKAIKKTFDELSELNEEAQAIYKKQLGIKRMSKEKKDVVFDICASVICNSEREDWKIKLNEVIEDNSVLIDMGVSDDILVIAAEHNLGDYEAAVLYHSTKLKDA